MIRTRQQGDTPFFPNMLNNGKVEVGLKEDVDKVIREKDAEIESLKASHYADSVDAGMRERRLRRTLWLARALRARDIQRWWLSATLAPITERACRVWNNIEIKCRKKAEEYR